MPPRTLPDFTSPPLAEAVLGIQFDPIEGFASPHLGLLWARFRDEFPDCEEKPALDPVVERFGTRTPAPPEFRLVKTIPPNRVWLVKDSGELLQIQQDRLLYNWRASGGGEYPRYEALAASFRAAFRGFLEFLDEEGLSAPKVNQCEVTYLNVVRTVDDVWTTHSQADRVVSFLDFSRQVLTFAKPEDLRIELRYPLQEVGSGGFVGRLRIELSPAFDESHNPVYRLTLTARGEPRGADASSVEEFFEEGRSVIVRAFADLTTEELHKAWGRVR